MKRFLLILFVAAIMGCNSNDKATTNSGQDHVSPDIVDNPATASGVASDKKLPVFKFEATTHDFGTIHSGERMSYESQMDHLRHDEYNRHRFKYFFHNLML